MKSKKIRVVMLECGKVARCEEINNSLESMQKIVGGLIEAVYPFEDEVCIICNDEGKLQGLPFNRALYDDKGNIYDIISGTAFICGCKNEYFSSLTEEQINHYCKKFEFPERFALINGQLRSFPVL